MRIRNNLSALIGWRQTQQQDTKLQRSLERLSSGLRVGRAGDDAAGLALSEKMRAEVRSLNQAARNGQDGISLLQTAESGLAEVHAMLHRMREVAVQAANGTLTPEDRALLQVEMDALARETTRLANTAEYNRVTLLNGGVMEGALGEMGLQVGSRQGEVISFGIGAVDAFSLGIARDVYTAVAESGDSPVLDYSTSNVARHILGVGPGLERGGFALRFTSPDTVQLWSDLGQPIGSPVAVSLANPVITVGDASTGRTLTIELPASLPGANTMDVLNLRGAPRFVASVGEVGSGLAPGSFEVRYDHWERRISLYDVNTNERIGVDVPAKPGATVLLGDKNSDKTVQITLGTPLPAGSVSDVLHVGTPVGKVTSNPPAPNHPILPTPTHMEIGVGLRTGSYHVAYDSGWVQLRDQQGRPIGEPMAYASGDTVTLGDPLTGRSLSIRLSAPAPTVPGVASISVVNNDGKAQAAQFSGGEKRLDAHAVAGLSVRSQQAAEAAIGKLDEAIGKVNDQRAALGATQNRVEHTITNLHVMSETLVATDSRIRDLDVAQEMTNMVKAQILLQSSTAMLAKADMRPQAVLELLQAK